jgi:hypothetical protein
VYLLITDYRWKMAVKTRASKSRRQSRDRDLTALKKVSFSQEVEKEEENSNLLSRPAKRRALNNANCKIHDLQQQQQPPPISLVSTSTVDSSLLLATTASCRQTPRDYRRTWIANMSAERRAAYKEKNRIRERNRIANMSEQQRAAEREKCRIRKQKWRANMSELNESERPIYRPSFESSAHIVVRVGINTEN